MDEATYQHKMRLLDSLSFYRMEKYDTLYRISTSDTSFHREWKSTYYGWITNQDEKTVALIKTNGTEFEIEKQKITKVEPLKIDAAIVDTFVKARHDPTSIFESSFGDCYLLYLWLYKKGSLTYSKALLPENDHFFSDDNLRNAFGILYYDAMLSAFSVQRDYSKAIEFGNHLSKNIYKGYEYQKEAIALTRQLKNNPEDFKTFRLPDSLGWVALKQKLNRNEQITYLGDRLRLLNCIQPGQPAGISYQMYQFSIPISKARGLNVDYWEHNDKYGVVNPYWELIRMKLTPVEVELLLPYLLTETYIPTYTYHRDFFSERTLHKLTWVAHDLIFEITNKRFFTKDDFDSLSFDKKKEELEKVRTWCEENATLSHEQLIVKILKTADLWNDFNKALETAKEENYAALLPIIAARFGDFNGDTNWTTSNKSVMAETMFELGGEKYITTVKQWNINKADIWVNLWCSLFLLKYDKDSYEQAMTELESILKDCDGTYYYPHAMDLLLSMNDKRALKLAEGILDKRGFPRFVDWDYYLNFVKKLLALKSDYTFNAISKKLGPFTPEEVKHLKENNGGKNMFADNDSYTSAVDKLKGANPGYNTESSIETRSAYREALAVWFTTQYALLKAGKPNELHLNIDKTDAPVTFIDSAAH